MVLLLFFVYAVGFLRILQTGEWNKKQAFGHKLVL